MGHMNGLRGESKFSPIYAPLPPTLTCGASSPTSLQNTNRHLSLPRNNIVVRV
jgi:hypothetical protein